MAKRKTCKTRKAPMSDKQKEASSHNWLLFRVAGIRSALALRDYRNESNEVQQQVIKVDEEAKKLQELLRGTS